MLNEVINPTRLQNSSDIRQVTWASYNQCHNLVLPENVCFNASYLEPLQLLKLGLITPAGEARVPSEGCSSEGSSGCERAQSSLQAFNSTFSAEQQKKIAGVWEIYSPKSQPFPQKRGFQDFSPGDLHPICWVKTSLIKSQSALPQNTHVSYSKWPQFPDKPPEKGKSHVFLLRKRKLECSSREAESSSCLPLKACSHTCKSLIKHTHKL